ncbi:MAG: calcium/sodium antiporter [Alistipes sp.]|nr:calcium/sodium antiporter [Alistipes sp.]MBQ8775466.1 calcium/sodium antiporter [Alistipes sp.]
MEYLLLILGFVLIIVGATALTDGSVALAARFRVPEFIVGLTIVAVGTSMPEFVVSLFASIDGNDSIAIGNIVGSNIFNIFAILGICAIFAPLTFSELNIRRDIPLTILATVALVVVTLLGGDITRTEGIIFLLGYIVMMALTIRADRKNFVVENTEENDKRAKMPYWRIFVWIVGGLLGLIYGGQMCVDNAVEVARSLGVSEATIAITLIAGGTSLPELASSLVSIWRGSPSLALGNVLGSNIANILLILGVCSTVTPLTMGGITMFDVYVALAATVVVMLSALVIGRDKLTRIEGVMFLVIYAAYVYVLIS